jgi:hypothetical protein
VVNGMTDDIYKNAERLHGVPLISRYNHDEELEQMRGFLSAASAANLHDLIRGIFYDSNANLCVIESVPGLTKDDPEAEQLWDIACRHIAQFEWLDAIGHKLQA